MYIKYFLEVLKFLDEFSWIFKSSNTNFLTDGVFECIPTDWLEYFQMISTEEFNQFPDCSELSNLNGKPKTLQDFCEKVISLRIQRPMEPFTGEEIYFKKMSPKKIHEISRLAQQIDSTCSPDGIEFLVDFGSGLGYLSEILHKRGSYKILGLECDEERVGMARKRQETCYPQTIGHIFYRSEFITRQSEKFIIESVREIDPHCSGIAIVGLHSCADLTITSIQLFLNMEIIKKLFVMPCCYHKMGSDSFPLSQKLRSVYKGTFLNRPFLRLACQETSSRWNMSEEKHLDHGRNMFYRAALDVILGEDDSFSKNKKPKSKDLFDQYSIISPNLDKCREKYQSLCEKYKWPEFTAEVLTCLQNTIQSICEDLILEDRICFIKEETERLGIQVDVEFRKIVNDKLSPRCFLLIAEKKIIS